MICEVFLNSPVYNLQLSRPGCNANCNSSVWLTFNHSFNLFYDSEPQIDQEIKNFHYFSIIRQWYYILSQSYSNLHALQRFAAPSSHGSQSKHAAHCTCSKPAAGTSCFHARAKTTATQQDSLKTRCHLENESQSKRLPQQHPGVKFNEPSTNYVSIKKPMVKTISIKILASVCSVCQPC